MDSVLLSCSTLLPGWLTRMFPRGIGIFAGLCAFLLMLQMIYYYCSLLCVLVIKIICLIFNIHFFPCDVVAGFVKTFQSFFVGTRLMWRTGRLRPSKSHFTGRRTCSTTRFRPSQTTTLRSHSSTSPGSLQGKEYNLYFFIKISFVRCVLFAAVLFLERLFIYCT